MAVNTVKVVKLRTHPLAPPNDSEFIFPPKEFPFLKFGDVVEIYDKEVSNTHLLLPVTRMHDEFSQRETISVEETVAKSFKLVQFRHVCVSKVEPTNVSLDLVELSFKEQYISRSDMWRLRKFLIRPPKSVVYLNKKIEFSGMRCQVQEMWSRGERVACGVILPGTRVVFRSASAAIHIFVQMSAEMWEFDYQGDLYFEKCVNGFFPDLFKLWHSKNCAHYATLIVFSRWFYDSASSPDDFPVSIRSKILQDNHGRFYQDFYRLIVQNEFYDDWQPVLGKLKRLLNEYKQSISRFHSSLPTMPPARNSSAQEGNYLEVINLSLNIFAKHYIDRTFERTGQSTVIVTPGQGVFKVDRNLCNLTKQRVNDVGLSIDLVCLGEQPLHAVPLFIFPSKRATRASDLPDLREDFIIPHWMNFSFYSPVRAAMQGFVPRIKIPESVVKRLQEGEAKPILDATPSTVGMRMAGAGLRSPPVCTTIDYDAYDDAIFAPSSRHRPPKSTPLPSNSIEKRTKFEFTIPPLGTSPLLSGAEEAPELSSSTLAEQKRRNRSSPSSGSVLDSPPLAPKNLSMTAAWNIPTPAAVANDKAAKEFENQLSSFLPLPTPSLEEPAGSLEPEATSVGGEGDKKGGSATGMQGVTQGATTGPGKVWKVGSADDCCSSALRYHHQTQLVRKKLNRQQQKARKPLMNPFKPAEFSVRITSNRRRFIHIFPVDSAGLAKQAHHLLSGMPVIYLTPTETPANAEEMTHNFSSENLTMEGGFRTPLSPVNPGASTVGYEASGKTLVWAWGVTGEEQWNPDLKIGVDW